jgi:hypothetical protein
MAFVSAPCWLNAQGAPIGVPSGAAAAHSQTEIPDAPVPQLTDQDLSAGSPQTEIALTANPQTANSDPGQTQNTQPPTTGTTPSPEASGSATQSSSSQQSSTQQPDAKETEHQKAEEEVREQEHQRVAGIVPSFNVTYHADAVALSPSEKLRLQFRASIDPYTFAIASIVAGLGEANDDDSGFGWGPGGYGKRVAAAYGDNVIGNTLGNAVLPIILHQDPRYYRLGHGTVAHRFLYAFATTFICKHDDTHKWEPNYSNVLGNMIAGEISQYYTPGGDPGKVGSVVETGLTVTFEGSFGGELQEFWPDISRKFFHKDPTHGLDAQARAEDAAQKRGKQEENQKNRQ